MSSGARGGPALGTRLGRRLLLLVAGAALAVAGLAGAEPPGAIRFTATNLVATAEGEFHDWRIVQATVDDADPGRSGVEVEVALASLDTKNRSRDEHLRSEDFFDVARFPTARAILEGFRLEGADGFVADVTLDLHGVSRTFPMRFRIVDREARRISGKVTLDRTQWGIGEPYTRWVPLSIRNEVELRVETTVPPSR